MEDGWEGGGRSAGGRAGAPHPSAEGAKGQMCTKSKPCARTALTLLKVSPVLAKRSLTKSRCVPCACTGLTPWE